MREVIQLHTMLPKKNSLKKERNRKFVFYYYLKSKITTTQKKLSQNLAHTHDFTMTSIDF